MNPNTGGQAGFFEAAYEKLNTEQRRAVDSIEGPVMVNAGPGTGKTQILALRIANILYKTDTDPAAILCLTYTENGAVEMRNRLLSVIGSAAYKIRIHTFHSFCNEVIQDNLNWFGKLNLAPIGDLEEIDLFYRLIDSIEPGNPLKRFRGEVYYEAKRLKSLYSLMKKEAWTPEFLDERITAYLQELPTKEGFFYKRKYKTFNAGDPKPDAIKSETEKMEVLRAAAWLYPRYNSMMSDAGRYNFDDMILWVLDAFGKNSSMLADYQEKFLYFLVDEFQDTSRAQNLLLQQLTGYWPNPNLFVVGDADQSIFSFQDANVENILEFEKKYADSLTKIDLVNNYRSSQTILDAAHHVIEHNLVRTVQATANHPLYAANPRFTDAGIPPIVVAYPNPAQEAVDIAAQIENLIAKAVSGNEIAVIYRNHAQVTPIVEILEQKKIPVNTRRKTDLLQLPFIQNITKLLTWIRRETYIPYSGDDLLFQVLHCDFFSLSPLDIAKLNLQANAKKRGGGDDPWSLRRLMAESPQPKPDLFSQSEPPSIKSISDRLESLLKASASVTLQQLLEQVIQKAGIIAYIMQSPEKPWLMQVLNAFFQQLKEENKRNPDLDLATWLDNLELMRKNRLPVPLYKITSSEAGVNMVTAHGAKGSEFEHVFVIGCTENIWDEKGAGSKNDYKLPDNLVSNHGADATLEENRRLFYVAITRAKSYLQVSYAAKDEKDKTTVKSSFVGELIETGSLQLEEKQVNDDLMADYTLLQFAEKARPEIALVEEAYLGDLLKRYTLSVTHLNNFLDCPLKFYYQNLIKVPAAKNDAMAFGSAIHWAIERLFVKMKNNNGHFPPKEDLLADFNWHMENNREAFTPEAFKLKTDYGAKILPAYYDYHINRWNKIIIAEKQVRNVTVANVPINGKLDKLEFNGKLVNVVDYKTGSYQNAKKKLAPPHEALPNGGDYWRQAVFYKILLDNDSTNDWLVTSTEFDFIEPVDETYKTEKIAVSAADIATVTHQITDTWAKIQSRQFKVGCGKPDCEWCRFVKTNGMAVDLHPSEEEV